MLGLTGTRGYIAVRVDAAREKLPGQGEAVGVALLSIIYWGPNLQYCT